MTWYADNALLVLKSSTKTIQSCTGLDGFLCLHFGVLVDKKALPALQTYRLKSSCSDNQASI
ncbi:hypothetical protein [Methylobacter psychrophilus]|uniref:hypothetical protein n=1 Tax=Methylobacter psychrophilus TaxID=96941 RepID=UPI0021D50046|nr:hypothetical protein [Methylobacter psychrophilus]